MDEEIKWYFVPAGDDRTYYVRVDTHRHTDITPNLYSEFWDDIEQTCARLWPGQSGGRWKFEKYGGYIVIEDPQDMMLLKLSLQY